MRVLVVYCHPCADSFNAATRDAALAGLRQAGHDIRLLDLYGEGFEPVMTESERRLYHDPVRNREPIGRHLDHLAWAEALVFVYPTWWFGLPAMLKGWLDRVFVPHTTFELPVNGRPARPLMTHIGHIAVVTTCGASWFVSKLMGEPGRKTLLRGIRSVCAGNCRTLYLAHYKMDSSTRESRVRYLRRVEDALSRLA